MSNKLLPIKEDGPMIYSIENANLRVEVSSLGAELQSIKNSVGKEYLWQGDKKYWSKKAPLLFPIAGKLKNDQYMYKGKSYKMPMHGFASDKEFHIVRTSPTELRCTLVADEDTIACYPFDFRLQVNYKLDGRKILITYIVENKGDSAMLFTIGAHEGYACSDGIENYSLVFNEKMTLYTYTIDQLLRQHHKIKILEDSNVLELKEGYFTKHALVFEDMCAKSVKLVHKKTGEVLEVSYHDYKHLLIWTKSGAPFICIEPWCSLTDFSDSNGVLEMKKDVQKIEKGEIKDFTHSINIR